MRASRMNPLRRVIRTAASQLGSAVVAGNAAHGSRRRIYRAARATAFGTPLSGAGLLGVGIASWIATSPSLLPRTWWMWAVNYTASSIYGYSGGVLAGRATKALAQLRIGDLRLPDATRSRLRWAGGLALLGVSAYSWVRGANRQREISHLVHQEPKNLSTHAIGTVAGLGISTGLLVAARAVITTARLYRRLLRPYLPGRAGGAGSVLLTSATLALVVDRLVRGRLLERMIEHAEAANLLIHPGIRRPTSPMRSGSPVSTQHWESLGAPGRKIVAGGAPDHVIADATGQEAMDPIRVYAGKSSRRSLAEAVDAVIAELDRTHAWDRDVLALFTGTGTGWLQEWSLSAIEFLTRGNCATASLQYSVYSSALNYLLDRRTPQLAGKALFEAVRARMDLIAPEKRPRLFVAGESLGSFAGQSAFADIDEMLARVDGAVWTGTPGFTPIWRQLTESRRPGSPQIAPVIGDGRHIRFATRPQELWETFDGRPFGPWDSPRIAYVQHASDPVVWWQPRLLWERPAWLRERVGRDVTPAVRWAPWITFWQIAADMPLSAEVGGGHGHAYHEELLAVWASVLGLDPRTDRSADAAAIREHALRD